MKYIINYDDLWEVPPGWREKLEKKKIRELRKEKIKEICSKKVKK